MASDIITTVGQADLGLPYLYNDEEKIVEKGEGVWLAVGDASSNPTVGSHRSAKYKGPDEFAFFLDAQGMTSSICETHKCKDKIISLVD